MSLFSKLCIFVSFNIYIFTFAAIMYAVEKTEDGGKFENHVTLQNLSVHVRQKYNMTKEEFDDITRIIRQSQAPDKTWTYSKALRFTLILCTTIGYGDITPQTEKGMLLCILGALIGIPLTLMTLNIIGTKVTDGCTRIINTIETRLLKRPSVQSMEIKRLIFILMLLSLMILMGAVIVREPTGWSLIEGVYFWFITFSTIGFGDYIAVEQVEDDMNSSQRKSVSAGLTLLFILVGLALLASFINCVLAMPKEQIICLRCSKTLFKNKHRVEDDDHVFRPREKDDKNLPC